jgi:hypothetical protein
MKRAVTQSLFILALAFGCDGEKIDAGNDGDGGLRTYAWKGEISNSYGVDCPFPIPDLYKGQYEGEFDDYVFPSGSKKLRVSVEGLDYGNVICGSITFGEGDPPALPPGPDAPYAPGLPGDPKRYERTSDGRSVIVEGFPYEFGRSKPFGVGAPDPLPETPSSPLSMAANYISMLQPYKAWCNEHDAYRTVNTYTGKSIVEYSCIPGFPAAARADDCSTPSAACEAGKPETRCYATPVENDDSQAFPISCTRYYLCYGGPCICDTDGCTVPSSDDVPATLTFDAGQVTGTADIDLDPGIDRRLTFRLNKVSP